MGGCRERGEWGMVKCFSLCVCEEALARGRFLSRLLAWPPSPPLAGGVGPQAAARKHM